MSKAKAISVLSDGLDSAVATAIYAEDYDIMAITLDYDQQSLERELDSDKALCDRYNMKHEVIKLPWLAKISNSSFTSDEDIPDVEIDESDDETKALEYSKSIWVPARNTVF